MGDDESTDKSHSTPVNNTLSTVSTVMWTQIEFFLMRKFSLPRSYISTTVAIGLVASILMSVVVVLHASTTEPDGIIASAAYSAPPYEGQPEYGNMAGGTVDAGQPEIMMMEGAPEEDASMDMSVRRNGKMMGGSSRSFTSTTTGSTRMSASSARQDASTPTSSMFVHRGSATVVVDPKKEVDEVMADVENYANEAKGYVESKRMWKSQRGRTGNEGRYINGYMTLRIPSDSFSTLFDWLERSCPGVAYLREQSIDRDDVTQTYVDVQTRVQVKRASMERLQEIMKKAATVQETLNVQREMNRLTEEIESNKKRQQFLENQASFSTVSLNFEPAPSENPDKPPKDSSWNPFKTINLSLKLWVKGAQFFIDFLIVFVVVLLPITAFLLLLTFGFVAVRRNLPGSAPRDN